MADRGALGGIREVQHRHHVNAPTPKIHAGESLGGLNRAAVGDPEGESQDPISDELQSSLRRDEPLGEGQYPETISRLFEFAGRSGSDISDLLDDGTVSLIGTSVVREYRSDEGSRDGWLEVAERGLDLAAQDGDEEDEPKTWPYDGAANIHYPVLTVAVNEFASRAYSQLVKGDKVVGVKAFEKPGSPATPDEIAKAAAPPAPQPGPPPAPGAPPQPPNPQDVQAAQAQAAALGPETQIAQKTQELQTLADDKAEARANRVKMYLNWLIFYKMDSWEDETDLLLHEAAITGSGFKKIYMSDTGVRSDYISATKLTVHNKTKSLERCPRLTQEFEIYPWEIEDRIRSGRYRDVALPERTADPEAPRRFLEQLRLEDLDEDGLREPYICTVDLETAQVMRIEPAYDAADVVLNGKRTRVLRIERWNGIADFKFMPDPRGSFYGIGFARLLNNISDTVDAAVNQLTDAGTAAIAGGGFIAQNVRLQGSGQSGVLYFQPGEYAMVNYPGQDIRNAIYERTLPQPSDVTFKMLELLLVAAKEIGSIKDVNTGNTSTTAPVGTTLAVQSQALEVFSAIWKRFYRGFKKEFRLIYEALQRWGTDRERAEYRKLTGGDFDEDFSGDSTDIVPVADPAVVTRMQKISRIQAVTQLAESPVGVAAGMTQPGPAQEIAKEALDVMDWDRPDRFIATVPPNELAIAETKAKTADMEAAAQVKQADAKARLAGISLDNAKALRETGLAALDTHEMHKEADRIAKTHSIAPLDQLQPPAPMGQNAETPGSARPAAA